MAATQSTDFYNKPRLTTITYAVGLLLFLLPFFNIECNNMPIAHVSGLDMATGTKPSMSSDLQNFSNWQPNKKIDNEGDMQLTTKTKSEAHLLYTALAALVLGAIGLLLSFMLKGRNQKPNMIVGILGALALIGSWIELKSQVTADTSLKSEQMVSISVNPTFWFILCLLCYIASAFISYKRSQDVVATDIPAHLNPQIKIHKPDDQTELPAAPTNDNQSI